VPGRPLQRHTRHLEPGHLPATASEPDRVRALTATHVEHPTGRKPVDLGHQRTIRLVTPQLLPVGVPPVPLHPHGAVPDVPPAPAPGTGGPPGIAATAIADPPTTEAALLLIENLLGTLLAGGLNAQDAAWAADIFAALVTYAAIEDDVRRADRHTLADELHAMFTSLPADQFPLVTAHAAQLVAGDGDERFRFAIDVVIDGMLARAARR